MLETKPLFPNKARLYMNNVIFYNNSSFSFILWILSKLYALQHTLI